MKSKSKMSIRLSNEDSYETKLLALNSFKRRIDAIIKNLKPEEQPKNQMNIYDLGA